MFVCLLCMLCCNKSHATLVNGVFYTVERVDKKVVVVRMDPAYLRDRDALDEKAAERADKQEGEVPLSHKDASVSLRLTHALCYASVQGLTIRDRTILMLDAEHPFFSVRAMIVGISRVTDSKQLHVATRAQEEALISRTRPVQPPPEAEPESDSEDEWA